MKKSKLMKSKKSLIFLMIFLLILQMTQAFTLGNKAFADEINYYPFITHISLTDKDGESYDLNTKEFEKDSDLRINLKFEIPSDQQIEKGKKFKINIPKEFNVKDVKVVAEDANSQDDNYDVTTETAVSAKLVADMDTSIIGIENNSDSNDLIVTFNKAKDAGSKLSGELSVDTAFNSSEIGNVSTKNIVFTENSGISEEFLVKFSENDNEIKFPFITGVYLSDKEFKYDEETKINFDLMDENFETTYASYLEDHLNKTEFEKNSQMYIGYKFMIPEDQKISEGQKFTVEIPNEFAKIIKNSEGIALITEEGVDIGTVMYLTDNKVTITFSNEFSGEHSVVKGNFYFGRHFSESEIGDKNPVEITFNTPYYDSKTFNFNFKQLPFKEIEPTITKTGEYSAQDQVINWKIEAETGNLDRDNFSILDELDTSKHKFKSNSLKVDGTVVNDSYFTDDKLNYNFGTVVSGQKKIIEFQTEPNSDILNSQGSETYINNEAILKIDGQEDITSRTNVKVKNDILYKDGIYNSTTKSIDWTIIVNKSNINFINPIITDKLPEYLALNKNTVTVDGNLVDSSNFSYDEVSREFQYNLQSDNSQHIIKFSTIIDPTIIQNTFNTTYTFKNSVQLDVNSKHYFYGAQGVNVGIGGDVLSKTAIGYDKSTKEITWKIVVNSIGIQIDDAKVTEFIDSNQEYVPNSISCNEKPDIGIKEVNIQNPPIYPKQYEIDLGTITGQHIITLKTKVTNDDIKYGNGNNSCSNSCRLTGTNIRQYSVSNSQNIDSTLIEKNGEYNYNTREITWSIIVNKSQTPIKDVEITDLINDGQEYVDNSFSVERIAGNQDQELTPDIIENGFSYEPTLSSDLGKGGELSYKFGNIKDSYKITFITKVAYDSEFNENNDKIVKNEVQLKTSETNKEIKSSKTITIKNYLVNKDSVYVSGNDFITWRININRNNIPLDGMKITDRIPEGLQIDMDSVKLYEVQFDSNGNSISDKNKEVSSKEYTTSYDFDSRDFVLEYLNSTNKSYLLQFDTLVKTPGSSFSNSVKLESNKKIDTSATTSNKVQFSEDIYGGSASMSTGTIVITKVDKDTNKVLSGAKFALIKDGNRIQVSEPTGADGKAIFKRLKFGSEYLIKEIEAPYGYALNDEDYKFTIEKNQYNKNVKEYNFSNEKLKKNIELLKISSNEDPVKGAEFKLYLASDTNFDNPIKTAISDENGFVIFNGVDLGNYIIKELKAPQGYISLPDTVKIEAKVDGSGNSGDKVKANPYKITNELIKKTIQFYKQSEANEPLEGASFALYKQDDTNFLNPLKGAISDNAGLVAFEDVDYGNYVIKESMAPQGYDLSNVLTKVYEADFIKDENSILSFGTVINSKTKLPIKKSIEFYKKSLNGTPLNGAIFAIYNENDDKFENTLGLAVSNSDGLVKFTNIEKGSYKIKEIKAPRGYSLTDIIIHVKDSDFSEGEVIITNPDTIINKKIKSSGVDKDEKDPAVKDEEPDIPVDKGDIPNSGDYITPNNDTNISENMNSTDNSMNQKAPEDVNELGNYEANENTNKKDGNLNNKSKNKVLPQAGSFIDFTSLISFGTILILLGIACIAKKKHLVK